MALAMWWAVCERWKARDLQGKEKEKTLMSLSFRGEETKSMLEKQNQLKVDNLPLWTDAQA